MAGLVGRWIDMLANAAAVVAAGILAIMVGFVLYEIVLRAAFASSTYVLDEFIGYGVASMTFLSLAAALRNGVFIRVGLVLSNVGPGTRRLIEILSCALGTALFGFVGYYFSKLVMRDFARGTVSNSVAEVPLWIPEGIMLCGVLILVLQFAALTVRFSFGAPILDNREEL